MKPSGPSAAQLRVRELEARLREKEMQTRAEHNAVKAVEAQTELRVRKEYETQIRHYEGLPSRNQQLEEMLNDLDSRLTIARNDLQESAYQLKVQTYANISLVAAVEKAEQQAAQAVNSLEHLKRRYDAQQDDIKGMRSVCQERYGEIQRLKKQLHENDIDPN